jgi:hypothetical protein
VDELGLLGEPRTVLGHHFPRLINNNREARWK